MPASGHDRDESLSTALATAIHDLQWSQLPADLSPVVRLLLLDGVGVTLAGCTTDVAEAVVRTTGVGDSGRGYVVIGHGHSDSWESATLANGAMAHALDFDDYQHPTATVHATAVLLPALVTSWQMAPERTGREVILAYAAGLMVMTAIGARINPGHYRGGWHPTGTIGTFGASAAAARMLGLDPAATVSALGIAASQASGVGGNFGTMVKPLHAGLAARNGVQAAVLAAAGVTASARAIDGPRGFMELYSREAVDSAGGQGLEGLLDEALTGMTIKRFASCAATHCAMDAAVEIHAELRAEREAKISRVRCQVHPQIFSVLSPDEPNNGREAKFSLEYAVAVALVRGRGGLAEFEDSSVQDPGIRDVARTVEVETSSDLAAQASMEWPAVLEVELSDGRKIGPVQAQIPRGRWPYTWIGASEVEDKFTACAAMVMDRGDVETLRALLLGLADLDSPRPLVDALGRRVWHP